MIFINEARLISQIICNSPFLIVGIIDDISGHLLFDDLKFFFFLSSTIINFIIFFLLLLDHTIGNRQVLGLFNLLILKIFWRLPEIIFSTIQNIQILLVTTIKKRTIIQFLQLLVTSITILFKIHFPFFHTQINKSIK